jgi:peptidoglycan/xylan/chitin deacetylase (PgdA/CDA1 family)
MYLAAASLIVATACSTSGREGAIRSDLRAPAYPLVTIDPYTSAWSMTDCLYDGPVRHWTGEKFPLTGAIRVDGQVYRFMGVEETPLDALAPMAETERWTGRYTRRHPGAGWEQPDFDDSRWTEGEAAFGSDGEPAVRTRWDGDGTEIFVRREINLDRDPGDRNIFLEYSHDDDFTLCVNGVEVVNTGYQWRRNVLIPLEGEARQTLRAGRNVIAAHGKNKTGGALVDFGLYAEAPVERSFETVARQLSADVQATQTRYRFACGPVELLLTFTAPLLMHDLELLSRPVNYISYEITPADRQPHDVEIYFDASPAWALDRAWQESVAETSETDGLILLRTGSASQPVLQKRGDNVRIDWGHFYLCAEKTGSAHAVGDPSAMRARFRNEGSVGATTPPDAGQRNWLALSRTLGKISKTAAGMIMLGYDDLYSVQYFGQNLRPYWNRDGSRSIESVFAQALRDYAKLKSACDRFDRQLMTEATETGGKQYAELCALAYRQSIAAHKLVEAPNGDLLFLSKENFSNGSIGTVDVTYPSSPLFLLYNPELAKALLNHIFYFSESGRWTKPFAAHDVGTYPQANGQTYGGDMPVEESGNMLILTAAIAVREGSAGYAEKHWPTLTLWADYLVENGLDPENQLCTDDFAGHFAHNANLSIKAILGIASYGYLAGQLDKSDVAEKYTALARRMAGEWVAMADDGDHFRLTFDQPGTWSQKYNLVWDKLLKLDIFPPAIAEREIPFYLTKQNVYGLPLDNRETYTKSDWIIWTATLAPDRETFEKFVAPEYRFMNETVDRIPMSDWYYTDRPKHVGFQARSVVGGYFVKMLEKELIQNSKFKVQD